MSDPVYDKYVAQMRALITSYGAQNAIHALELAFIAESADFSNTARTKKYCSDVAEKVATLYYDIEKL